MNRWLVDSRKAGVHAQLKKVVKQKDAVKESLLKTPPATSPRVEKALAPASPPTPSDVPKTIIPNGEVQINVDELTFNNLMVSHIEDIVKEQVEDMKEGLIDEARRNKLDQALDDILRRLQDLEGAFILLRQEVEELKS
eukprot:g15503.t1